MGRPPRALALHVVSLLGLCVAKDAFAAAPRLQLDWTAPPDCPSRAEVLDQIRQSLDAGGAGSVADVQARVSIERDGGAYRAQIVVGSGGVRTFDAESCRAAADAAALVVAFAVTRDDAPDEPTVETRAEPPSAAPPAPDAAAGPGAARAPFAASASLLLDSAILPSTTYGADLALSFRTSRLALEADVSFLASQTARLATIPSQGARAWLAHLGARACYALFGTRLDVGPCLGAGPEWIVAQGFGAAPDRPASATGVMFVVTPGGRAVWRLSPAIALRLGGEAVFPFGGESMEIDGGGVVFHTPAVSFRASAGAEAYF